MTALPTSPALLMIGVLALLLGGAVIMVWGRRLPRQGDWVVGLGLLVLLVVVGMDWSLLSTEAFAPRAWLRGWIWPRDEAGAITVGVLRDPLGLTMAALTALTAASLLIGTGAQTRNRRGDRFCASLAISASGAALAWFSLTPWLAMTGVGISVFGGFLAMGSQWQIPAEAALATRFGWERSWGLIVAVLGLCVLGGARSPLSLAGGETSAWSSSGADVLGAALLFLGAMVQLQPFPLLGWVLQDSKTPSPSRIVLAQVFPAWTVFAVLIRLEPQLRETGVLSVFGWVGLLSAALASVAGLLRGRWRLGLSAWTSAGFSIAVAALAFAGPSAALCLAVGVGLGASALAGFASALEEGGGENGSHRARALWAKTGCALGAAAGTGFAGFVAAGGGLRWLTLVADEPALLAGSAIVFFFFALLGWKVAFDGLALEDSTQASWGAVLAPYIPVLLSLGVGWTGTATGGVLPGDPDRVLSPLLALLFGAQGDPDGAAWEDGAFATASGVFWGGLVVAIAAALWTAGKKNDFWPSVSRSLPRFTAFVGSGYGIDALVRRALGLVATLGRSSQWLVDRKFWGAWVPTGFGVGLGRGASYVALADAKLGHWLSEAVRRCASAPARLLQLVQNGDVQWYLFFAVGSGIAILFRFMKT